MRDEVVMTDIELNKKLYQKIFLIRTVEEKIRDIYPSDVMKTPVHLSLGEESIAAGVCQALSTQDQVFGTYRNHALYLAKDGNLDEFIAELWGKKSGVAKGKAGSMHMSAPEAGFLMSSAVVGSIIPVALGAAYAAKFNREEHVVAVFFGDGATEEGVFWESLNIACHNGLAIHALIQDRQSYSIPEAVKSFGPHVFSDDTTDAEKIYHYTQQAIRLSKRTGKPSFLHLKYHRYLEHVGINEDYCYDYRASKEDYRHCYAVDPVKIQREKLNSLGIKDHEINSIEKDIEMAINKSMRKAETDSFPGESDLLEDVYA
jgi:pyruvate dehydrogenase E1 component alpha subunit